MFGKDRGLLTLQPRFLSWLYRRLGRAYPTVFVYVELHSALLVAAGTLGMFTFYYEGGTGEYLLLGGVALGLTLLAIHVAAIIAHRRLRPVRSWIGGERDPDSTVRAWRTAVDLPVEMIRREWHLPFWMVALPMCVASVLVLDLAWTAALPIFAGIVISIGYASVLHHFALEVGMRPVVIHLNESLPPQFSIGRSPLPLGLKLLAILPLINIITGLTVAGLISDDPGSASLGFNVLVAVAVAFTISFELTALLTKSILRPVDDLKGVIAAVREGDFDVHAPVTTSDELGELSVAINQMIAGLAERERLREAFGTYLDKEVAEYILREEVSASGENVEVSILFCDVRDFTRFAAGADAEEVVAALNELFEAVVPIIYRHGGHVDKFVGDGLLAVFGAPAPSPEHADQAVAAACEMASVANGGHAGPLRVGIGVNSGRVVAGSIGGAGRLNFSVIGDPVNVAARVEAATRETGDDVLLTEETRRLLRDAPRLVPRGPMEMKGKVEPVEVFSPAGQVKPQYAAKSVGARQTA